MKNRPLFLALALTFFGLQATRATTVIPPTFDELVSKAEVIFQGTVTDVRSQWIGEGAQHRIVSYVTFNVEDAMKGTPGATYTLRMLGGTVDGETMEVTDTPKFAVGDRDVLFVENNGSQFVPLVGIMHGRFHVETDPQTGREIVTTNERKPLVDLARVGKEESAAPTNAGQGLTAIEFKTAIRKALQDQSANQSGVQP